MTSWFYCTLCAFIATIKQSKSHAYILQNILYHLQIHTLADFMKWYSNFIQPSVSMSSAHATLIVLVQIVKLLILIDIIIVHMMGYMYV